MDSTSEVAVAEDVPIIEAGGGARNRRSHPAGGRHIQTSLISHRTRRAPTGGAVVMFVLGLAAVTVPMRTFAQNASACAQREPIEASDAAVPGLSYTCLRLGNGRHVWVGEAGTQHSTSVLLIHGLGDAAHRDWRHVILPLAQKVRVVAIDLPGFGASESSPQGFSFVALTISLTEVLDRLRVERAHVVGHSLGGALALYFAYAQAGRVDRLVLVDAAGLLQKSMYVQFLAQASLPQTGVSAVDQRIAGWGAMLFRKIDSTPDLSAWLALNPTVRAALLGRYTQIDAALGLVEHDFTRAIADVRAPTVLIWGREDPIAPLRAGTLLVGRMRDARLYVLDNVAHVPMTADPSRFMDLLLPAILEPLPVKRVQQVADRRQGDVECRNQQGVLFTGRFASLSLYGCTGARIENAAIDKLVLVDSETTITFSEIGAATSAGPVFTAQRSRSNATVVDIRGAIGLEATQSDLDFAGVALHATKRGIVADDASRIYFSVSTLDTPELKGDAHFRWSVGAPIPAP